MSERKKTWRKSIERDGITKSLSVREIENGYIVTYSEFGWPEDADEDAKPVDVNREFFSKENPLDKKEEEEEDFSLSALQDIAPKSIEDLINE